jgi:hypothetical protein
VYNGEPPAFGVKGAEEKALKKTLRFTFESNWLILHFPGRCSFQQGISRSASIKMLA